MVPIGSDYQPDTLELFARAAAERDTSGHVLILVLPITYSREAERSSNGERQQNLSFAERRRGQVEAACEVVAAPGQTCEAQLLPTLTRDDAFVASNLAAFTLDVDGMYILGGDQTVAMGVVADTPLEAAMADAYARGVVVGGNSAGDAVQSENMIAGYTGGNGPVESLRSGAVDLWASDGVTDRTRGLIFGLENAIDEQHVFEYGRTGRALNVAVTSGLPVVAMDAATGGRIVDESVLSDVTGDTASLIIDPVSYGADATFGGPNATLSTRGVALHLVPPGAYGYDLGALAPTVGGSAVAGPSLAGRTYPALSTPTGAGPLLLSGGLAGADSAGVLGRLTALAGGDAARIVVLAGGYARSEDAKHDARDLARALQPAVTAPVAWVVLDDKTDTALALAAIGDATGILLTAPDGSRVLDALATHAAITDAVAGRWTSGAAALLADDAAAAALGPWVVADGPKTDIDAESMEDFLRAGTTIVPGLGWVGGLSIRPRLLADQNWGGLFRLAHDAPAVLAVGLDGGTALEVAGGSGVARGAGAAVVLDAGGAQLGWGTNDAMAARWVIADTFVDGESLVP
jgi:cyanophycinase-like exopeptidase